MSATKRCEKLRTPLTGQRGFSIEGQGQDGETVEVMELMVGMIDGMSFVEGVPKPSIDEIEFDLSMILKVESAEE